MKDDEKLLHHNYDGIRESDNPMPRWWLNGFYITIIFAAIYYGYYEFGKGPTLQQEYTAAMEAHTAQHNTLGGSNGAGETPEQELSEKVKAFAAAPLGKEVYDRVCLACHAAELQGLVGPDLTDEYWIHGQGLISDMRKVIRDGVLDKGMPSWGPSLKDDEIYAVIAFIISKRGTKPANAKPPQGTPFPDYLSRTFW